MKVIISNELEDKFSNFVVVDTFKKVTELQGVSTLIIHKYSESDFDAGVFITNFHNNNINQFIYINSNPSAMFRTVMKGVNGHYYEDEFYFEDEEELLALLEEIGIEDTDESTELAAPALDVVSDFVQSFARGEERIKAPLYLERVENAINDLSNLTHQQELQITTMGSSALEVFEKASVIIKSMDTQRKAIEKQLQDLENSQNDASEKVSFSNNVFYFSPYKYIGNAKVLVIREYAPCRYLTSFCLGYVNHLHYELNKRPKLVFVHQKGQGVALKYSDFTSISDASEQMSCLYDEEIVATNSPKKDILKALLTRANNDYIVVVDRLYGKETIVSGRVVTINAVGSKSDIERYKIRPEETIFSITNQPKQLFTLGTIKNFPPEVDARLSAYSQVFGKYYKILDYRLGIREDD